jgi:hypothetical protein
VEGKDGLGILKRIQRRKGKKRPCFWLGNWVLVNIIH